MQRKIKKKHIKNNRKTVSLVLLYEFSLHFRYICLILLLLVVLGIILCKYNLYFSITILQTRHKTNDPLIWCLNITFIINLYFKKINRKVNSSLFLYKEYIHLYYYKIHTIKNDFYTLLHLLKAVSSTKSCIFTLFIVKQSDRIVKRSNLIDLINKIC